MKVARKVANPSTVTPIQKEIRFMHVFVHDISCTATHPYVTYDDALESILTQDEIFSFAWTEKKKF